VNPNETSPIVPMRSTPGGNNPRRMTKSDILVNNNGSAPAGVPVSAFCRATNPSTRLMIGLAWGFAPQNTEDTLAGLNTWTVQIDGWKRLESGLFVRVNTLQAPISLPFSFDTVTSVDEIRSKVVIPDGNVSGVTNGYLWFSATWEPAPGDNMPDGELRNLFNSCQIAVQPAIVGNNT
jgi:hypothetical protein